MKIPRFYKDLGQNVQAGKVLVIYGPRRIGKTTLLMGLLKECYTTISKSNFNLLKTTVSYCSQSPRMHAGTVRTNVCFESYYKRER